MPHINYYFIVGSGPMLDKCVSGYSVKLRQGNGEMKMESLCNSPRKKGIELTKRKVTKSMILINGRI